MAGDFASLLVPISDLPKPDRSWLDQLATSGENVIGELGARKSFNGFADRIGGQQATAAPQAGFLSRLMGGGAQQQAQPVAAPMTAPVAAVDRGPAQGSTFEPFMATVKAGGVTNPNALAAIAATGKAESGWSATNANRSWNDPSQSGQAGQAGGIMSWRNERLQNLQAYAASKGEQPGAISPQTQAEYFLKEDPQLVQRLNQAKSPQEAADIMAGAWRFAGYDQQGGEAERRRAMAQSYSSQFMEQGDGGPQASAYQDPYVSTPNSLTTPSAQASAPPVNQVADSSGQTLAPAVTPVQRGGVDPSLIQSMLRDPNLREYGMKLWEANAVGQKPSEPWQFVNLPDGTLARANQQTGEIQKVGQFAKPQELPNSYQEFQLAQKSGFQGTYADWEKVKQPGVTVNNVPGENSTAKAAGEGLGKLFSGIFDQGLSANQDKANVSLLRSSLANSPTGVMGGIASLASDYGVNLGPNADQVQVAKSIIAKMVPAQRVPGSGTTSDRDLAMFQDALPRLSGDPKGNAIILDTMDALANLKTAQADIVTKFYADEIDQKAAVKQLQALPDPFTAYKSFAGQTSGETQLGAPTPKTEAEYNALPSGTVYTDPDDGKKYRKP